MADYSELQSRIQAARERLKELRTELPQQKTVDAIERLTWQHEPDRGLMWRVGLAMRLARLFPGLQLVVLVVGDRVRLAVMP